MLGVLPVVSLLPSPLTFVSSLRAKRGTSEVLAALGSVEEAVLGMAPCLPRIDANASWNHQFEILTPATQSEQHMGFLKDWASNRPTTSPLATTNLSMQRHKRPSSWLPTVAMLKSHLVHCSHGIQTASLCPEGSRAQLLSILTSNSPLSIQGAFGTKLQERI